MLDTWAPKFLAYETTCSFTDAPRSYGYGVRVINVGFGVGVGVGVGGVYDSLAPRVVLVTFSQV